MLKEFHSEYHRRVLHASIACLKCRKDFILNRQLKCHRRTHTGEKPGPARIVEITTAAKADLRPVRNRRKGRSLIYTRMWNNNQIIIRNNQIISHQGTHTEEKPYTCQGWGKSFSYSSHQETLLIPRVAVTETTTSTAYIFPPGSHLDPEAKTVGKKGHARKNCEWGDPPRICVDVCQGTAPKALVKEVDKRLGNAFIDLDAPKL